MSLLDIARTYWWVGPPVFCAAIVLALAIAFGDRRRCLK